MTITPLQLTAEHIGKPIPVQKADGTAISGKLTGLDMHIKLQKTETMSRVTSNIIVRQFSESDSPWMDCSCLIGATRVTIGHNDTILVEE